MHKPIIKLAADFGPLLIFFIIYFSNENDLKVAIPPFIIATLIALITVYFLEKKNTYGAISKRSVNYFIWRAHFIL